MKRLLRWLAVLGLVLGLAVVAYSAYISTRQARLLSQARRYLAKSNAKTAMVCLRRALRYNPRDAEACRLMAELTEKVSSPAALLWRSRVVEVSPKSVPDRLALAQTALIFRDYLSATNALEGVSKAGKLTAAYHGVAGSVAAATHQLAEAERHYSEASRLEPTNPVPRLNLAVVRLQSTNSQVLAEARTALRLLCTNALVRSQALRELVAEALRSGQAGGALAFSGQLLQETNTVFSDMLLRLDVLRDAQGTNFLEALAGVQQEAANDSRKTYELVMWQVARSGPVQALAWLKGLPAETQTNQPGALLIAHCLTVAQDWRGLQASLDRQYWAELDFVRRAYLSLALRGQNLTSSSQIEWKTAFKATGVRKENLIMLLRLAASWNWVSEVEELLWTVIHNFPAEKWAEEALSRNLLMGGRTRSLMTLYSQQTKLSASDLSARNNLAMTALLLNAKELRPHDLALEVYKKAPTNSAYASTYAFSLYLRNKHEDALKVFERLKPEQLEEPAVAFYYALVLQAAGQAAQAKKYLESADRARLLPEERKLLQQAKAKP
jgi:Flp pilus assembly protein TadD